MVIPDGQERRASIRISELAKMSSALGVWGEIKRWNSLLSVKGLKPHLSAYQRFVCEPGTDGLLHTSMYPGLVGAFFQEWLIDVVPIFCKGGKKRIGDLSVIDDERFSPGEQGSSHRAPGRGIR